MGARLTLVPQCCDRATVEALERLLEAARAGRVIGVAYVALHSGDGFTADLVGTVTDHKLLARGICAALADTLR